MDSISEFCDILLTDKIKKDTVITEIQVSQLLNVSQPLTGFQFIPLQIELLEAFQKAESFELPELVWTQIQFFE